MKLLFPRKPYCAGSSLTKGTASLQKLQGFLSDDGSKGGILDVFKKLAR